MGGISEAEFAEIYLGRARGMRRTAYLLCGDWHRAEDLVQTAFARLYAAWPSLRDSGALDAYLRKTLVRVYIDESRRAWHRERPSETIPDCAAPGTGDLEDAILLRQALDSVPRRQRACLVLRFYDDCSVEATADALGCSVGTVKSNTARGLVALRAQLPPELLPIAQTPSTQPARSLR